MKNVKLLELLLDFYSLKIRIVRTKASDKLEFSKMFKIS